MKTKLSFTAILLLSLQACAGYSAHWTATPASVGSLAAHEAQIQFFKGRIQRSSLDGKTLYGPSFESVVRRMTDPQSGRITECVFQGGKAFVTWMTPTAAPLVYTAADADNSFSGFLTYADSSLRAWSYDINVTKPVEGSITGRLAEGNGARINAEKNQMQITKIWNNEMKIREEYISFSENDYLTWFEQLPAAVKNQTVLSSCR